MRLFLLLVAVPIIEIALFIEIGGWLGTWPTIGIVIATAFLGSILLRRQGLAVLGNVQTRLQAGENPGKLLAEGAMILVAGVLLLTPGFFTDAVGFALLLPPVRAVVWTWLASQFKVVSVTTGPGHGSTPHDDGTIDGVYEDVSEPSPPRDLPPRRN